MIVLIIVFQIIISLRDGVNKYQKKALVATSLGINEKRNTTYNITSHYSRFIINS